jgi:hypothetical protein
MICGYWFFVSCHCIRHDWVCLSNRMLERRDIYRNTVNH